MKTEFYVDVLQILYDQIGKPASIKEIYDVLNQINKREYYHKNHSVVGKIISDFKYQIGLKIEIKECPKWAGSSRMIKCYTLEESEQDNVLQLLRNPNKIEEALESDTYLEFDKEEESEIDREKIPTDPEMLDLNPRDTNDLIFQKAYSYLVLNETVSTEDMVEVLTKNSIPYEINQVNQVLEKLHDKIKSPRIVKVINIKIFLQK